MEPTKEDTQRSTTISHLVPSYAKPDVVTASTPGRGSDLAVAQLLAETEELLSAIDQTVCHQPVDAVAGDAASSEDGTTPIGADSAAATT